MYRIPHRALNDLLNDHASSCASLLFQVHKSCCADAGHYSPAFYRAVQRRILDCLDNGTNKDRARTAQAVFEASNVMPCSRLFHALADVDWLHSVELFPRSMSSVCLGRGRRRRELVRLMEQQLRFTREQLLQCFDIQGLMAVAEAVPIHSQYCIKRVLESSFIQHATCSHHEILRALSFLVQYFAKVSTVSRQAARTWLAHIRRIAMAVKENSYCYPMNYEWAAEMLFGARITI